MSAALRILLSFILSLTVGLVGCLAVYEILALVYGGATISDLLRIWIRANPFFTLLIVFFFGAFLGHLVGWQ